MQKRNCVVQSNNRIARDVYRMTLLAEGGFSGLRPGQFAELELQGLYLRRPISLCDFDETAGEFTIIYKAVGKGTDFMSGLRRGYELDVLLGLGNGYELGASSERPLLIGGGVGVPPLYGLAKAAVRDGLCPTVVMGFGSRADVFYEQEFKDMGCKVTVCTDDGSYGFKGTVTEALRVGAEAGAVQAPAYTVFYSCGPLPMLKAVCGALSIPGFLSLEERMGCGFGACMGCSIMTKAGARRVCKDGPVFSKEDIIW